MLAFDIASLVRQRAEAEQLYLEFLRQDALSMGLYVLPAGGTDPQQPHAEDEVYVVMGGRARITVAGETREVERGSIVFVSHDLAHRFHDISEELAVLVFFAPPESRHV